MTAEKTNYIRRLVQGASVTTPPLHMTDTIMYWLCNADVRRRFHALGEAITVEALQTYTESIRFNAYADAIKSLISPNDYIRFRKEAITANTTSPGEQAT
jgi:hypothetical protein